MKKGFLNSEKAKRKLAEAEATSSPASPDKKRKETEKEKQGFRVFGGSRQIRLNPNSDDLHHVPPQYFGDADSEAKKRAIFRAWPRDPAGKPIVPSEIRGKQAGNGLDLWGATLYDFYHVRAVPSIPNYIKISTGSKLTNVMRSFGETSTCKDELAWAENEESPKEILAWDPAEAIDCYELRVHTGCFEAYSMRKEVREAAANRGAATSCSGRHESATGEESSPEKTEEATVDPETTAQNNHLDDGNTKQPEQTTPNDEPPVESPFHPTHYPSPWPFEPFENPFPPFSLQRSIPLHLLPKRLHVHDPWDLLSVDIETSYPKVPWTSKEDVVHTYVLSLPSESQQAADEASKAAAAEEDAVAGQVMMLVPQEDAGETDEPAILAVLPKPPRKLTEVPDAHLYISPKGKLGEGNHSVVYRVEWELPRNLFCKSVICPNCVEEKVAAEVQKLKESGKWSELLQEARVSYSATQAGGAEGGSSAMDVDSRTLPEKVGEVIVEETYVPGEIMKFISMATLGSQTELSKPPSESGASNPTTSIDGVSENPKDDAAMDTKQDGVNPPEGSSSSVVMDVDTPGPRKAPNEDATQSLESSGVEGVDNEEADAAHEPSEEQGGPTVTIREPRVIRTTSYKGPTISIFADVQWQDSSFPGTCEHRRGGSLLVHRPVPRTSVFTVAAKLSVEHDHHLVREARNYLNFPAHFFQHWNGYNVVPPLHSPVPVGAVVPQFYGYYVSENESSEYRSPILLIEDCGTPVNPDELCEDDREECAALLFRFHYAGWLHESFAARNILVQYGLPTDFPLARSCKRTPSFRLIDFGRSRKYETAIERSTEEQGGMKLFHLHHFGK